jgi:hypothetical protein
MNTRKHLGPGHQNASYFVTVSKQEFTLYSDQNTLAHHPQRTYSLQYAPHKQHQVKARALDLPELWGANTQVKRCNSGVLHLRRQQKFALHTKTLKRRQKLPTQSLHQDATKFVRTKHAVFSTVNVSHQEPVLTQPAGLQASCFH